MKIKERKKMIVMIRCRDYDNVVCLGLIYAWLAFGETNFNLWFLFTQ